MKKLLIAFLFFGIIKTGYSQTELLVLPGQGIVINVDTVLIGIEGPKSLLSKIDSSFHISVQYDSVVYESISIDESLVDNSVLPIDSSWTVYKVRITWRKSAIFEFEGKEYESSVLKKIIVLSPIIAVTPSGLKTGDHFKRVFDKHQKTKSSPSYIYNTKCHCYYDLGICFYSTIVKKQSKAIRVIYGIEIF